MMNEVVGAFIGQTARDLERVLYESRIVVPTLQPRNKSVRVPGRRFAGKREMYIGGNKAVLFRFEKVRLIAIGSNHPELVISRKTLDCRPPKIALRAQIWRTNGGR